MKTFGNFLTEVTSDEGRKYFIDMYDLNPDDFMAEYNLKVTGRLGFGLKPAMQRVFNSDIQNIIVLEYDGEVNQIIKLEAGDRAYTYSDEDLAHLGILNSEQGSFIDVHTADDKNRMYFLDNSPYCVGSEEDHEWDDLSDNGFTGVVENIQGQFEWIGEITFENTLFVRQL